MLAVRTESPRLKLRTFEPRTGRASIGATRNPESTRAVLEATEAILSESGLAGLSMDEVARRARCGKPTIYRWWPTKAALLAQVHQRCFDAAGPARPEAVVVAVRGWISLWQSTIAGVALRGLLAEAQLCEAGAQVLHEQGLEPYRRALAEIVGDEQVDAHLHELLPTLLGQLALGLPLGVRKVERLPVMRAVKEPRIDDTQGEVAPMPAEAIPEPIRHRGEWID